MKAEATQVLLTPRTGKPCMMRLAPPRTTCSCSPRRPISCPTDTGPHYAQWVLVFDQSTNPAHTLAFCKRSFERVIAVALGETL